MAVAYKHHENFAGQKKMADHARNYTEKTLKRLFALSGNQCAFPGCTAPLVNAKNSLDSNICHIEAANEGGERYNPTSTNQERADYNNLILLCPQHHDETNDVEKYPVKVLAKMKRMHESDYLNQRIKKNPSMLKNAIYAISNISLDEWQQSESLNVANTSDKIKYNSLRRNFALIHEYKVFHAKINSLYDELELQGSIKKEKLLHNIQQIYTKIKGKYVLDSENPLEIIRENSDNIIDEVYDTLYQQLEDSDFFEEDILLGIRIIMVDAFIRCKVLEEPPKK